MSMSVSRRSPDNPLVKPGLPVELVSKAGLLADRLSRHNRVLIAYSGGVDSSFVAYSARMVLGRDGVLAVVADSPSIPRRELVEALSFARRHDIPCETVETNEDKEPGYIANIGERCYFCKRELYSVLRTTFASGGFDAVLCGTNADDVSDYRPGLRAADEMNVKNPLLEAGLTKEDIRALSRAHVLDTWDKPALACLASRIPYGEEVSPDKLARIEVAEEVLWNRGFKVFRVRHHGELARLEIGEDELHRFQDLELRERIFNGVKEAGFATVVLDPEPYRSGRLNEALEKK